MGSTKPPPGRQERGILPKLGRPALKSRRTQCRGIFLARPATDRQAKACSTACLAAESSRRPPKLRRYTSVITEPW